MKHGSIANTAHEQSITQSQSTVQLDSTSNKKSKPTMYHAQGAYVKKNTTQSAGYVVKQFYHPPKPAATGIQSHKTSNERKNESDLLGHK